MGKQKTTPTPHDDFFKLLFEEKEKAAAFIRAGLPPEIVAKLNLSSLEKVDGAFHDRDLGNFRADVIYQCDFGRDQKVTLSLLFEHKSYIPRYPHLQLLKYMLGIWEIQARNNEALRPVLPIVFYHGQGKWQNRDFFSYFENGVVDPDLQRFIPNFIYWLCSLEAENDDWILDKIEPLAMRIALLVMKHIGAPNILELLSFIFEGAEELIETEEGRRDFAEIYLYLIKGSKEDSAKIKQIMDHETFMNRPIPVGSTLWQMVEEYKKKAAQEAAAEATAKSKLEIALNLLSNGIALSIISEATGLSLEQLKSLSAS